MRDKHQPDRVFACLIDGQVEGAEMVASAGERGDMLITGRACRDASDALDSVTGWRHEGSDDTRFRLQNLDDLLDRPADVVGGIEV